MELYDTSVVVDYDTDDDYRRCLLAAFHLTSYDGLLSKIDQLSKSVNSVELNDKMKQLLETNQGMSRDLGFILLFSFDEFKTTHETLKYFSDKQK